MLARCKPSPRNAMNADATHVSHSVSHTNRTNTLSYNAAKRAGRRVLNGFGLSHHGGNSAFKFALLGAVYIAGLLVLLLG